MHSYCSLTSCCLIHRALSMPRLPSSTQASSSRGGQAVGLAGFYHSGRALVDAHRQRAKAPAWSRPGRGQRRLVTNQVGNAVTGQEMSTIGGRVDATDEPFLVADDGARAGGKWEHGIPVTVTTRKGPPSTDARPPALLFLFGIVTRKPRSPVG